MEQKRNCRLLFTFIRRLPPSQQNTQTGESRRRCMRRALRRIGRFLGTAARLAQLSRGRCGRFDLSRSLRARKNLGQATIPPRTATPRQLGKQRGACRVEVSSLSEKLRNKYAHAGEAEPNGRRYEGGSARGRNRRAERPRADCRRRENARMGTRRF